jgi:DNA-binding CsgD family transcriptional regulator/tetratricopeptide (TPR) repeat protein
MDAEVQVAVTLSRRERDCLSWTAQGKRSWDIGRIFGISENTVNFHLKNAIRKLGANSRTAAAMKAAQLVLLALPTGQRQPAETWRPAIVERIRIGITPFAAPPSARAKAQARYRAIADGLARRRWLDVITLPAAPQSEQSLADARDRGVEYILHGAVSRHGQQISLGLFHVTHDNCSLWRQTFGCASDAVSQDDRLVAHIIGQFDPAILYCSDEPEAAARRRARAILLPAIRLIFSGNREKFREAARLINRALDISPDNARVAAWTAQCKMMYAIEGWVDDVDGALRDARDYAELALRLDPADEEALAIGGHIASVADKNFETALRRFDRAIAASPHSPLVWALRTLTYCYIGKLEMALQSLRQYREIATFDPHYSALEFLPVVVHTFAGNYERAVALGRYAARVCPDLISLHQPLLSSLGHLGRREEAKPYLANLLALFPDFTVERFGRVYPFRNKDDRNRYMEGLSRACVPEH